MYPREHFSKIVSFGNRDWKPLDSHQCAWVIPADSHFLPCSEGFYPVSLALKNQHFQIQIRS